MLDIHTHILWGLDDGAPDLDTSLGLAKIAAENGTTDLFATPHVLASDAQISWETITARTAELNTRIKTQGIELTVYPGAELEMNWDMLDMVKEGQRDYCLAGSDYILVELPFQLIPSYADEFIYQMQLRGKIPIIAHPARHEKLMAHPEILLAWLDKGVLLQCNGGSLTGYFGGAVQENAQRLLANNLVHFIGSDAHKLEGRNTNLTTVRAEIQKLAGQETAETLLQTNPQKILDKKIIVPTIADDVRTQVKNQKNKKFGFWHRLFSK